MSELEAQQKDLLNHAQGTIMRLRASNAQLLACCKALLVHYVPCDILNCTAKKDSEAAIRAAETQS